jgi:hypothetical protein
VCPQPCWLPGGASLQLQASITGIDGSLRDAARGSLRTSTPVERRVTTARVTTQTGCTFRQRSISRTSPTRPAHAVSSAGGPRQRSCSTSSNRGVRAKRGELLEEQCELALVAEHVPGQRSLRNDSMIWSVATPMCVAPVSSISYDRAQHAEHAALRRIDALREAAQAVEVAEQLVRAVDEVHDHRPIIRCT